MPKWRWVWLLALGLAGCGGGGGPAGGVLPEPEAPSGTTSAALREPVFVEVGARARVSLAGLPAGQDQWLILASLSGAPGVATVTVNDGTVLLPRLPELSVPSRLRDAGGRDVLPAPGRSRQVELPELGSVRRFSVTAVGGTSVDAALRAVGRRCLLYVDQEVPAADFTDANLNDLRDVFDERIFPTVIAHFGEPVDVDGNERVIVLFTPLLNARGFGAFYGGDLNLGSPNSADMLYALVPQPDAGRPYDLLRPAILATLAHELQHLVNYSRKVLVHQGDGADEVWLNEALSFLSEQWLGYLDSAGGAPENVAWYLQSPERYTLRQRQNNYNDGEAGAAYLFVRYLVDRFGDGLAAALVDTAARGPENVTAATGQPFEQLVLDWGATLLLNGTDLTDDPRFALPSFDTHGLYEYGGQLRGPQATTVPGAPTPAFQVQLPRTGLRYLRFTSLPATGLTLDLSAQADDQVWAILVRTAGVGD